MNDKLDINLGYILNIFYLNKIKNHIFQPNLKAYLSIQFKIISFNGVQNHKFQSYSKLYLSI